MAAYLEIAAHSAYDMLSLCKKKKKKKKKNNFSTENRFTLEDISTPSSIFQ